MVEKKDDNIENIKDRLSKKTNTDESSLLFKQHIKKITEHIKLLNNEISELHSENEKLNDDKKNIISKLEAIEKRIKTVQLEKYENLDFEKDLDIDDKPESKLGLLSNITNFLNSPLEDIWEKVKNFSDDAPKWKIDVFVSMSEKISLIAVGGISWFLNSTIGKVLETGGINFSLLTNFMTKMLISSWNVIRWVYDVAKKTIQYMWETFTMLAKVGWKVLSTAWEILSTPVNIIYDIFSEVFLSVITSPLGFLSAVIALSLSMRFILSSIWPKTKDFFMNIALSTWSWIKNSISNIFFSGNNDEMIRFLETKKEYIVEMISNVGKNMISFYDTYIGDKIGLSSKDIMVYFSMYYNDFINSFDILSGFIKSLYKNNFFDELMFTWNVIKDIYYAIDYYLLGNEKAAEERFFLETLSLENQERLEQLYTLTLNNYASSLIQQNLIEEYLKNSSLDDTKLRVVLANVGEKVIDSIKSSKLFVPDSLDDSLKNKIFNSIDNSIIDKTINVIFSKKGKFSLDEMAKIKDSSQLAKIKLANLREISVEKDIGSLSKQLTTFNEKTDDEFKTNIQKLFKSEDINISGLTLDIGNGIQKTILLLEENNTLGKVNIIDTMVKLQKINIDEMQSLIVEQLTKITGKSLYNKKQIKDKLKEDHPEWSEEQLESRAEQYLRAAIEQINIDYKSERGSVVRGPVPVLVGEGNYPEIIVPINEDGMNFVKKSFVDVLDKLSTEDGENKEENKQDIVKTFIKKMPKRDTKLYDIKNLSNNHVVLG